MAIAAIHAELTDVIHDRASVAGETFPQRPMAMREALDEVVALPQMQREAVLLTAIEGQTHLEVAGTLGISHGAVRGLLYRARTTLRGAAAALAPESLICWLAGGAGGGAPAAARVAELSGAGGAVGVTGALLKGAVVAVSAGILVGGATVAAPHRHGATRPNAAAASLAAVASAPDAGPAAPGPARRNLIASTSTGVAVAGCVGLAASVPDTPAEPYKAGVVELTRNGALKLTAKPDTELENEPVATCKGAIVNVFELGPMNLAGTTAHNA